ncbi:protein kinase [Pyxidicoccus sp. QH1ED-7-1]|nr:protein kinase [Pyxidicoccus xibeiensis]
MGEIYLARLEGAQGFEKLCVIKKILPQLAADTDFVERFVGEARTLVRLSHGSIAQVLDMGLHEGEAYMALEHVDGKDLRKVGARVRDRQVPLPLTFILYTMGRVLDALAYAHRKKDDDGEELRLVHRDISPQNILISYEGEVKVIDFGLAKSRLSAAKTNPSIILGKFLYMSPEQARHQPVDRRSDLYAVGLCLYELICGKNPFDSVHPGELMSVVANPKIAPLDEVEPLTPRVVTALVAKALAVDPSQRFQTAEEFRGRLQSCLMEIDPSAGPESVSRFMRELFAADFQSERRLLATLKEVPRMPAGEGTPEDGLASRPMMQALLPPKTIRLDGPVEALSFHPTPRSREGSGPVSDGETRPGVMVDESTRPAFPMEALEEEARVRAARQQETAVSTVEVRPEAYARPPAEPAPEPRPPSQTREVPMAALPSEALPPEPRAVAADLRPTELAMPSISLEAARELPWEDAPPPPPAESTDPRAEPLPASLTETQAPRPVPPMAPASSPRPPPPPPAAFVSTRVPPPPAPVPPAPPPAIAPAVMPSRPVTAVAPVPAPGFAPAPAAVPARTGAVMMPAVTMAQPGATPPRTASLTGMPAVVAQPPAGATPPRTASVMGMPAVAQPPAGATPPRTASVMGMPAVAQPPAGATPSRGSLAVAPSAAELDVVPGVPESEAEAAADDAPGDWAGAELPVLTPEEMGHLEAGRPADMDTQPRAARPSRVERNDDTQPRVARDGDTDPRVQQRHDDTQPRVVLDEALLRDVEGVDGEQEEKSAPGRPRTGARRVRASSPGMPGPTRRTGAVSAVRPAPAPAPAKEDEDEDDDVRISLPPSEETRRTSFPVRPGSESPARRPGEDTRRTAMPAAPQRSMRSTWVAVGLGLVLLAGAILTLALSPALRTSMGLDLALPEGLPLPVPPGPSRQPSSTPLKNAPGAANPQAGKADLEPPTPPGEGPGGDTRAVPAASAEAAGTPEGARAEEAGAPEGAPSAKVAEAARNGQKPTGTVEPTSPPVAPSAPVAAAEEEIGESDLLLAPPSPKPPAQAQAQVKRVAPAKKPRPPAPRAKELTPLQKEWRETNALFTKLKARHSCVSLGLWCNRHADIKDEVEAAGEDNDTETLRKVKGMRRDLLAKQKELE